MDQAVVFHEEVIPISAVPEPVACPKCKGKTFTLHGTLCKQCLQEVTDGVTTSQTVSKITTVTLTVMECYSCLIRFLIIPDDQWELECQILKLKTELSNYTGIGKSC